MCAGLFREAEIRIKEQATKRPAICGTSYKRIDILLVDDRIAVSCKYQRTHGSVEEKLWGEIVQLQHLVASHDDFRRALLILGGPGFKFTDYWCSNQRLRWIPTAIDVSVRRFEDLELKRQQLKLPNVQG